MRSRSLAIDAVIALLLALLLAAFALALVHSAGDLIPRHNVYYGADTDRVLANMIDRNSNYRRLAPHPLFGLVGVVIQHLKSHDIAAVTLGWIVTQAMLLAILVYAAARSWGCDRPVAALATMIAASASSFIYWVTITETHFPGGISVLLAIAILAIPARAPATRLLLAGLSFAVSYSMVITNAVVSVLSQLSLTALWRRDLRGAITDNRLRIGVWACALLVGFGLLFLATAAQDNLLHNASIPPAFGHLLAEKRFVSAAKGGIFSFLNALAIVAPDNRLALGLNLLLPAATLWALTRIGPQRAFIALFGLFGLVLHCVYDRTHAFLFSPDYVPAAIVAVAIALNGLGRRRLVLAGMALLAVALGSVNLIAYQAKRAATDVQSDPPHVYADLLKAHSVPRTRIVRAANPPIGPDQ